MPKFNPLDELTDAIELQVTSGICPNKFPTLNNQPYRLAIIGEAPGADEVNAKEPFVGQSGRLLNGLLGKANIIRDACFIGNITQHRPPGNDINLFKWDCEEIQSGLKALEADLAKFNPHFCLLLGRTALRAANGAMKIDDWRGTFFVGNRPPFEGRKCLAAPHPARCLRLYRNTPLLAFDIKKALTQAISPDPIIPPVRDLRIDYTCDQIVEELERLMRERIKTSIDIEGYVSDMWCISVAESKAKSFLIPFTKLDGTSYWHEDEEVKIWFALAKFLGDPSCKKVLQNGLYDLFVLAWEPYFIIVRGFSDDTMLKGWELYCELPKGLGFQVSLYCGTQGYYKFQRKSGDFATRGRYCCTDSACTLEISDALDKSSLSRKHFQFNMELLYPMLFMELQGLRYDIALAKQRLDEVDFHVHGLQFKLDSQANIDYCLEGQSFGLDWRKNKGDLLVSAVELMCWKSKKYKPLKKFETVFPKVLALLTSPNPLSIEDKGFLSIACGRSMNIRSGKTKSKKLTKETVDEEDQALVNEEQDQEVEQEVDEKTLRGFKHYLYEILKLPKQYIKDPKTKQNRLSTNYESLLKLSKKTSHPAVQLAIDISSLRTRSQMLHISADADGRIRAGYNIVGSETGRITCYTSPTGSGYNLQTLPNEDPLKEVGHPLHLGMRDLVIADEGCYLGKCDLKGADGWTVGAHLNRLGDPTMLDDLRFGIKPAQVLCWMMRHQTALAANIPRDEIKKLVAEVKKDDWDYFAYKQCIWGFCYLMGARKAASHVFNLSEGKVDMKESEMETAKQWLFKRYQVRLWWDWMGRHLKNQKYPPTLEAASGHVRKFFGRERDRLGEALAHEPQANTTYATNSAAWRLWNDPENRIYTRTAQQDKVSSSVNRLGDATVIGQDSTTTSNLLVDRCSLRVKPMHQVHDELLVQFKIEDTEWAIAKIKQWFANPLQIAGQEIVIPFEGAYGTNWSMDSESKVGDI